MRNGKYPLKWRTSQTFSLPLFLLNIGDKILASVIGHKTKGIKDRKEGNKFFWLYNCLIENPEEYDKIS